MAEQTDYIVRLRPRKGVDGLAALQAALKVLGRRHGLRAVEVKPVDSGAKPGDLAGNQAKMHRAAEQQQEEGNPRPGAG